MHWRPNVIVFTNRTTKLKGKRECECAENQSFLLGVKLFCSEHIGIAGFETIKNKTDPSHKIRHVILFIHTMAVMERIAIKKNVP